MEVKSILIYFRILSERISIIMLSYLLLLLLIFHWRCDYYEDVITFTIFYCIINKLVTLWGKNDSCTNVCSRILSYH